MRTLGLFLMMVVIATGGCKTEDKFHFSDIANRTNGTSRVCTLVIGMENSHFAGACPGANLDSKRMYELICCYSDDIILLRDAQATKKNVSKAMTDLVGKAGDGLFILYYSGHGGSDPFPDTGKEEVDGSDEYLCLYDTYFRDNEVWNIISKCKGRVLCIFDCCHSATMYRTHKAITFTRCMPLGVTNYADGLIRLQCWSGCPDDTYSYGSDTGGKMTNTLLKYFKKGTNISYDELWNLMEKDESLKRFEIIQRTKMGKDFGKTVFLK